MKKWTPRDIVAVLIVAGAVYLLATGVNDKVGWALVAIVAGYYGIDFTPWFKVGRNQGKKKEE